MVSPLSQKNRSQSERYKDAFEPKSSRFMKYPEDFVRRVKENFPDEPMLHQRLDDRNCDIGIILKSRIPEITIKDILTATSLEALQEKARRIQEKQELYDEWMKLCKEQNIH